VPEIWATHSRSEAVIEVAKTIKSHWDGILNYFDSIITNGILEGINSIVQLMKRNARGYWNTQYFINMIYLKIGKLDFIPPIWSGEEPKILQALPNPALFTPSGGILSINQEAFYYFLCFYWE
jgi:hypothetical protein